jgi:hypothetical protein
MVVEKIAVKKCEVIQEKQAVMVEQGETLTFGQLPFSYIGIFRFKGSSRPTLMMLRIRSSISSVDSSSFE